MGTSQMLSLEAGDNVEVKNNVRIVTYWTMEERQQPYIEEILHRKQKWGKSIKDKYNKNESLLSWLNNKYIKRRNHYDDFRTKWLIIEDKRKRRRKLVTKQDA